MKKVSTKDYWIADTATVTGDVDLGKDVTVWYGAVIRGDAGKIIIGDGTNVQDNAVIHKTSVIGKGCTIGHNAVVHGAVIGDNSLIGMGAILLSGAVIGKNCIVGGGALVTGKTVLPDNCMLLGPAAKTVLEMDEEKIALNRWSAELYIGRKKEREYEETRAEKAGGGGTGE